MSSSSINPLLIGRYQRGLYFLSEGAYLLDQLNQNINKMVRLTEATNLDYQVYVNRYNVLFQNKAVLSNVPQKLTMPRNCFLSNLSENAVAESTVVGDVQQANKAIYQMAQAIMEFDSTIQWVDNQTKQTMLQAQQASEAMNMENAATTSQTSGLIL
ncbi:MULTISPECIES: hypothetical protein [unclassified Paenibacillus]|uniref:hypothetical protein n=1 Tax=unclassified Paenibacillus TaxID=185978 RepID=UPI0015C5AEFC|nr:hypothetical protein [Paenibacillus sp. VTT E-133280]